MKLYLEEDEDYTDEQGQPAKRVKFVQEVTSKDEAKALKKKDKSYLHKCYHDEKNPKPCKREIL